MGLVIAGIAFGCEFVDSTLGMGYGTTLTPLLLLMGFSPLEVVPAVLFSELLTGLGAAVAHHRAGNVNLFPKATYAIVAMRRGGISMVIQRAIPKDLKVALLIGLCSVVGTVGAFFLAVNISKFHLKLYIGVMVLAMGVYLLLRRRRDIPFSWGRLLGLGVVASFNKGLSGGGYGPLVTGGQLLSGVESKNAVAITSLAEALVCLVGVILYIATKTVSNWGLFPYMCGGALLSVPLCALAVKRVPTRTLRLLIALLTVILGALTLIKTIW
ncbi:MAG: sulfite exporter TauE/SafE family protein [Phycisphaerae bacterium]|nr:sulfite exporter TauE/SafE family protein [Phycisphaerae bacterium]